MYRFALQEFARTSERQKVKNVGFFRMKLKSG
jgi:hypothetical protein